MNRNRNLVRKMCATGVLAALSYVVTTVFHFLSIGFVPGVSFLTYDPKDILICISGFALGPIYAFGTTVIVSLIEMVTISNTGIYGFIMNVIATCAFVIPASLIYKNNKKLSGAILSLLIGFVSNIIVMTLWNIIITPIYMGVERSVVVNNFLLPIVIFNMIKTGLNVAFTLVLYKPVVKGLIAIKLMDKKESKFNIKTTITIAGISAALIIILLLTIFLINNSAQ